MSFWNRPTSLFTVPSVLRAVLQHAADQPAPASLGRLLLTGEMVDATFLEKLFAYLPENAAVWNLFGASEFPYVLARRVRRDDLRNASTFDQLGRGVTLSLAPPREDRARAGKGALDRTELIVGGPTVFSGYLESGRLTGGPGPRGFRTGDLATKEDDGAIRLLGRIDRMVKVCGVRADLDAIEAHVESHPDVVEAAVVPTPDLDGVVAFVASKGADLSKLRSQLDMLCRGLFTPWICPREYRLIGALPRTSSGKKDREVLAEMLA